jgi:low affinity Fe/Cu permease
MTLDDRFTDLTDIITERAGSWRVTLMFLLAIICWGAVGPLMHYSDSWQLWVNTPTTVIELFLGQAQLASSNRIEKHIINLLETIKDIIEKEHTDRGKPL